MQLFSYKKREKLIDCFLEYNTKINLSSLRTPDDVYKKHILDSLSLYSCMEQGHISLFKKYVLRETCSLLDVGTGGGFPLLPLAFVFPHMSCVGIDARRKKVNAVREMIHKLGLNNAHVLWGRVEHHKKKYNIVTARAVKYADTLFDWLIPVLRTGGYMVLRKLRTQEENSLICSLVKHNGCYLEHVYHYSFEDKIERVLYIIKKI